MFGDHATATGAPGGARLWYTMAVVLLLLAGCAERVTGSGALAAGARPPSPTATPTPSASPTPALPGSSCPQSGVPTRTTSLANTLLRSSPDGLPLASNQSGPVSPAQLLLLPGIIRIPGARQFINAVGYVNGFERAWSRGQTGQPGNRTEYLTIYEFGDGAGACAFAAWEATSFKMQPVARYSAIGMVGNASSGQDVPLRASSYLAPKGRYVVMTGLVEFDPQGGGGGDITAFSIALLNRQYGMV